jgi:hypothetical protein
MCHSEYLKLASQVLIVLLLPCNTVFLCTIAYLIP